MRAANPSLDLSGFVMPAFDIYNGVAGLYDFGPAGCAVKDNFITLWKQFFVLEENMLQVETTTLTPEAVLEASGHVKLFVDLMVKDTKTGECYRADKLLENAIEKLLENEETKEAERDELRRVAAQADAFSPAELHEQLQKFNVKAPATDNELTEPFPFNLMFTTTIGPQGHLTGYLRPETAQGIFVNFPKLLQFNNSQLPFAGAQIGLAYRNEISPRGGLLRVREFCMAEIEHFVDPEDKEHPKFGNVADVKPKLFPNTNQLGDGKMVEMTFGEAVEKGIIANTTLAYFMGRTYLFLRKVGIKHEGLRFRQHLKTEMAHYASDCWDAEVLMSSGWVECVGHADRAAFDLTNHSEATNTPMVASRRYDTPKAVEVVEVVCNNGLMGKTFKKDNKAVKTALEALAKDETAALAMEAKLASDGAATVAGTDGKEYEIQRAMVTFTKKTEMRHEEKFVPGVIEPSFGVGRILTGIFEHNFVVRAASGGKRKVLTFNPSVAPYKVVIYPLDKRITMDKINPIRTALNKLNVANTFDSSGVAIGRRYSRSDELGVPFGITVDFESETDAQVTLRERDTCGQIRLPIADVAELVRKLSDEEVQWADVLHSGTYVVVTTGEEKAAQAGGGAATATATVAPATGDTAGTPAFPALKAETMPGTPGRFARPAAAIAVPSAAAPPAPPS